MNEPRTPEQDDRLLDHEYDGIQEYDNPLPRWWIGIFWVTIVYAILYALNVPGVGIGKGRIANYEAQMAKAAERYAKTAPAAEPGDDALRALAATPHEVEEGRLQFQQTCSPCHRADAGGMIGPNLTDRYWLHGGHPSQIYHTVRDGVPAKGMPVWGQVLKPDQLAAVVAYVLSLHNTSAKAGKGPEGVNGDSLDAASAPSSSSAPPGR